MIGPNGPAATLNQQADAKFFSKNQIVNEKVFTSKIDYNKLLSEITPKIPFGKIDNIFKMGDWDVYVKGESEGNCARVSKCQISRAFSFGNRTAVDGVTWGPDKISLFGAMDDSTSIKANVTVIENEGKLSIVAESIDPLCFIRKIILRNGEAPEVYLNNGKKDSTATGIVVHFADVQKSGDNISLTASLESDFGTGAVVDGQNPLKIWPNLNIWFAVDVTNATAQNYMELSVQDTVKFMLRENKQYTEKTSIGVLMVNPVEGYTYPDRTDATINYYYGATGRFKLRKAMYELGMRKMGDVSQKNYMLTSGHTTLPDSVNGMPVMADYGNIRGPPILIGDLTNLKYPFDNVNANFFRTLMINNIRKQSFVIAPIRGNSDPANVNVGDSLIMFEFEKATNEDGKPYYLQDVDRGVNGKLEYVKYTNPDGFTPTFTPFGYGTDTTMANNTRIRVIDNRHIIIEDVTPESMKGDRFFVPQAALTPYAKNDDTTGVGVYEPIAQTASIRAYPNPTDGMLNVEVSAQGQTWVNLVDMYGRVVKNVYNGPVNEKDTFPLDASQIPSGIYFLQVRGTTKSEAIKVEIIH